MAIQAFADLNCSIARPLSILGERWALLVVRDLFLGRRRFDEIQESLGIASNVLSQRLATLTEEGIVERHRYSEQPERFEYRLTDKGRDLQPILLAVLAWGDRYTTGAEGPPLETVHRECGHVFHAVPTCSECGEEVEAAEHREQARPRRDRRAAPLGGRTLRCLSRVDGPGADRRLRLPRAELAGLIAAEGWAVRGTSRGEEGLAAIEAAGIEAALADPDRPGTLLELVGDVTVVHWLLGSAGGDGPEPRGDPRVAARAGPRKTGRHPGPRLRLRGRRGASRAPCSRPAPPPSARPASAGGSRSPSSQPTRRCRAPGPRRCWGRRWACSPRRRRDSGPDGDIAKLG